MTDNRKDMSCEEFSACMAHLVAAGADIYAHPHVQRCKLHRALLDDLEAIAIAAKQLFPDVDPPDTVWDGIQARLDFDGPRPLVTAVHPGYRVITSIRVAENHDPHASPPPSPGSATRGTTPRASDPARRTLGPREGRR
jgi:hypothetical protein